MRFIRHSFPHAALRQHIRPSVGLQSPRLTSSRRCFATERPSGQTTSPRWLVSLLTYIALVKCGLHLTPFDRLLVSIGLGLPIPIYLWQRGDIKKPSTEVKVHTEPRGANQEYSQRSEASQDEGQNGNSGSSNYDVVRSSFSYLVFRAWFALSSFGDPGC